MASQFDPDQHTKSDLFTKDYYRDVYPAIDPTSPELSLAGKVTIITGASKGIGKSIAVAHAKAGSKGLILVGRTTAGLEETKAAALAANSALKVLLVPTDISDEASVDKLYEAISGSFDAVDTLINNAGVFTDSFDVVGKVSPAKWWTDFDINVKGTFLVTAGFLKLREKQASSGSPTIVNLVTSPGLVPPSLSSYFISKLSVMRFTEHLANENPDLAVFSISPGITLTDMTLDGFKPFAKDTPELTAGVTVYLAAKRPAYLFGRYFSVNWDVKELEARKAEIVDKGLLKVVVKT